MNEQDRNDPTFPDNTASTPETTPAGFCQQCGTALNERTRRAVGNAVYCEPCLEARLTGAPFGGPYTQVPSPAWTSQATSVPSYTASPVAGRTSAPNPIAAALLGVIPGVGAMYNEQYAKGIAHLAIFALLVVFSDESPFFGIFIAGWIAYMAIEAYHTARARRDGAPLPNPFGFNELGDRLGFARTSPPAAAGQRPPVAPQPVPQATADVRPPGAPAGMPSQPYPTAEYSGPFASTAPLAYSPVPGTAYETFPPAEAALAPAPVPAVLRFPAGAVWLILLGVIFLLSTTGLFRTFSAESLVGWSLLGLAAWIFLRRYKQVSNIVPGELSRINRGIQASAWFITAGVLALLDAFSVLRWGRSWPIFLIVAGGLTLLSRLSTQEELGGMPVGYRPTPGSDPNL